MVALFSLTQQEPVTLGQLDQGRAPNVKDEKKYLNTHLRYGTIFTIIIMVTMVAVVTTVTAATMVTTVTVVTHIIIEL